MSRARAAVVATLVCLFAATTAKAGINFAGAELTSVSPKPDWMAVGDLNNDGRADIVVVSPESHEMNVYLAADTPSHFAPARVMRFGQTMRLPAMGDLNNDGRLDVVVADQGASVVWILLGMGDGTFLPPYQNNVPNSRTPYAVAIADFDGVGGPELAVTDRSLGRVFILRNDNATEPRFSRLVDLDVGEDPVDIRAIDMNSDGHVDLMTLNTGGPRVKEVAMMLWKRAELGTPDFALPQKFTIGENPYAMVTGDFNNDGNTDIAMLNRPSGGGNNELDVLLSTGQGVLLPPVSLEVPCPFFTGGAPCRSLSLAAGDFDGNGNVDLAVALADPRRSRGSASSLADAMQVFSGRGDGGFVPGGVFAVEKNPISMGVGDISGDGKPDIAIANQRTLSLQAFINVSSPADKGNGDECLLGDECISSRCLNGRCCGSQCDLSLNEVCNVPGREGICTPLPPAGGAPTCQFPQDCNSGFCFDGFCCDEDCTGGRCDAPGYEGLCIPGAADGSACSGDGRECASGFCSDNFVCCKEACTGAFCDDLGDCHALSGLGVTCNVDEECASNVCDVFDGICCNRKCDEVAEYCSTDGHCARFDATTQTPGIGGTPTPLPTHPATPGPDGDLCSAGEDCGSTFCVNGVCCHVASCNADQHCEEGSGVCVTGTPAVGGGTPTPTATPIATVTGGTSNCGGQCAPQNCINNICVVSSTSSGCSTGGSDAPAGGNLLVVTMMPFGLWLGRRWQLRRAVARSRAPRA